MIHSRAFAMSLRSFVALSLTVSAFGLGASCVPIEILPKDSIPGSGASGGAPTAAETGAGETSAGAGGSVAGDGGATAPGFVMGSYMYLCGGSQQTCSPDPGSDDCTLGGLGVDGGASDASVVTCQLVPSGGVVASVCGASGPSDVNGQCAGVSDCQAGLGCATSGEPDAGSTCRPYCCDSLESCPSGTYCTTEGMGNAPKYPIPVCIDVTTCELLTNKGCMDGQVCAIVRADGTTSCVTPGNGTAGESCPCAGGYTCSWADNTCLELCSTLALSPCGPAAFCEGGVAQFHANVGYCVSY
jgi:hypothetical protein